MHSSLETILERSEPTAAGQYHSLDHGIALVERVDVDVLGLVDRRNDLPLEKGGREGGHFCEDEGRQDDRSLCCQPSI